jgi:hypothetical protein
MENAKFFLKTDSFSVQRFVGVVGFVGMNIAGIPAVEGERSKL